MSEKLHPHHVEHAPASPETTVETHYEHKRRETAEKHHKPEEKLDSLESIKTSIEHHAKSAKEVKTSDEETQVDTSSTLAVTQELKQLGLARNLTRVRKKLSLPDKTFSKVIHQPAVDAASEAGAKTVARSSGILGGGIVSFFGSLALLWAARHYGFEYNFIALVLLFAGGYALGLIIELVLKLVRRND